MNIVGSWLYSMKLDVGGCAGGAWRQDCRPADTAAPGSGTGRCPCPPPPPPPPPYRPVEGDGACGGGRLPLLERRVREGRRSLGWVRCVCGNTTGGSSAELADYRSHRSSESNANRQQHATLYTTRPHSFAYTRGGVGSRNAPPEALTYRRCVTARYRSWAPEHVACEQHGEARRGVGVREFLARQRRQCIQETAVRQAALFLALTLCECEVNLRVCDCPEASGSGKPRQPW